MSLCLKIVPVLSKRRSSKWLIRTPFGYFVARKTTANLAWSSPSTLETSLLLSRRMPWAIPARRHPPLSQPPPALLRYRHLLRVPLRTTGSSLVEQIFWPSSLQISLHNPGIPSPLSSTRRITPPHSLALLHLVGSSRPLLQAARLASTLACTWWFHSDCVPHVP